MLGTKRPATPPAVVPFATAQYYGALEIGAAFGARIGNPMCAAGSIGKHERCHTHHEVPLGDNLTLLAFLTNPGDPLCANETMKSITYA